MTKTLLTVGLLLVIVAGSTAQIHFEQSGFHDAQRKAGKERKILFVYLYTDWCTPCKELDSAVFADSAIDNLLRSHFVCLKLNAEQGEGKGIKERYKVGGYPMFLFLTPTGKKIGEIIGTQSNEDYLIEFRSIAGKGEPLLPRKPSVK